MTNRRTFVKQTAATAALALQPTLATTAMTTSDSLAFKSAIELAAMVASKEISAVELAQYYIQRIERFSDLNAVVVQDFDRALEAAAATDAALAKGAAAGPLQGVPMTIKESYNIAGLKTTWGLPAWEDMVAKEDAMVVQSYKAAGATFLGKTNVPLMLGDYQSFNEIYGTTNNPWDQTRGPGGSSGGSAAALAAGLCGLESGSDIGGSIRNPAHYCGVYGHKPTHAVVPMAGHQPPVVPFSNGVDLAVVGPMARSADDLKLAMDLITGPLPLQQPAWRVDLPPPRMRALRDLRIAIWANEDMAPVDDEIAARALDIGKRLETMGATVSTTARPQIDYQAQQLSYLYLMEAVNNTGVPDEVYKHNLERANAFAPDDMSIDALFARAAVQSHHEWGRHKGMQTMTRLAWKAFFTEWDVLICPISATTAFKHDHRPFNERTLQVNGETRPYFESSFWAGLFSFPGLPSTVFPTGLSKDGLPIGLQAVAGEYFDYTTIEFARLIERELGGFIAPEGYA